MGGGGRREGGERREVTWGMGGGEKAKGSNPTWEQIDSQIFSAISFFPQLISSDIFFPC